MKQVTLLESDRAEDCDFDHPENHRCHQLLPELAYQRVAIVNVIYHGRAEAKDGNWVLIDCGLPSTSGIIKRAIAERFGKDSRLLASS